MLKNASGTPSAPTFAIPVMARHIPVGKRSAARSCDSLAVEGTIVLGSIGDIGLDVHPPVELRTPPARSKKTASKTKKRLNTSSRPERS